jgi:tRNA uridine 5-carbamoylmethylation protein Kti12
MRQVYILRGVSGAGKSTMADKLRAGVTAPDTCVTVSADTYFMQTGTYQFDPTKLGHAHGSSQRNFLAALQQGVGCVIVDNTNIKLRDMKFYIDGAKKFNYDWTIVQVETVNPQNVHGVPPEKVAQMQGQLESEFLKMPDEWKRHLEVHIR